MSSFKVTGGVNPFFPQSPPLSRKRFRSSTKLQETTQNEQRRNKNDTVECDEATKIALRSFMWENRLPTLLYRRGTRSHPPATPTGMQKADKPVWFAVESGRSTYGPVIVTYELKHVPVLYNVGSHCARDLVFQLALDTEKWSENYLDRVMNPDYQWSGATQNAETTHVFRSILEPCGFDGTFIDETAEQDLEGAEEMVLWRNFTSLLKKY